MIRSTYLRYKSTFEVGWSFSCTSRQGINLLIRDYIFEQCRLREATSHHIPSNVFQFSLEETKELNQRITSHYDGQKRAFNKVSKNRTSDEILKEKEDKNKKGRLDAVSNI